jgi:hypothetical protein
MAKNVHLANTLIHLRIHRQRRHLCRRQLQHAPLPIPRRFLLAHNDELLFRERLLLAYFLQDLRCVLISRNHQTT